MGGSTISTKNNDSNKSENKQSNQSANNDSKSQNASVDETKNKNDINKELSSDESDNGAVEIKIEKENKNDSIKEQSNYLKIKFHVFVSPELASKDVIGDKNYKFGLYCDHHGWSEEQMIPFNIER